MEMSIHDVLLGEVADPVVSIVLEHQRAISLVNILMFDDVCTKACQV